MSKHYDQPFTAPKWPFTPYMVAHVPDLPGVFALWEEKELIYVGGAVHPSTLRGALEAHLRGQHGCTARASHYAWQLAVDPARKERELLARYRSGQRAAPRCNAGP